MSAPFRAHRSSTEIRRTAAVLSSSPVVTAQRGGTFRETLALVLAYVEARKHHGESELLDDIVSAKPEIDRTRYHSAEELKEHGLQHLRDAVELLERTATPEEVDDYKRFVLNVADQVANAHREGGESVSADERAAIEAGSLSPSPYYLSPSPSLLMVAVIACGGRRGGSGSAVRCASDRSGRRASPQSRASGAAITSTSVACRCAVTSLFAR